MTPSIVEVESRMRPGSFSRVGFLGERESLQEVLEADRLEMERLNLTFERLSESLERLIEAAESSPSREAAIRATYLIKVDVHTGFQICPWATDPHHRQCDAGKGVRHASVDWWIRKLKTGQELRGPGLAVHLIRDHHFCQGRKSPLRVDPRELAQFLGLT